MSAAPVDDITQAARLRDQALKGNEAWSLVESLTTEVGPRLAGTEDEARARAWAVAKLKALGFENVRVEPFDMQVWVRGVETARVLGEHQQNLVITALGSSGATSAKGIEGEIVYFPTFADLEAAPAGSLKSKIAFVSHRMMPTQDGSSYGAAGPVRRSAPSLASSKDAAAILIRSLGTDYHRNPHTGSTGWQDGVKPIPAAALSIPDAEQLERLLSRGRPVRLHLTLTPRTIGTRQSGNVIAEIMGSEKPDEIVVIGGHLDSWDLGTGAIDDGAGVAITTAAAKLIRDSGLRPRRTIRVVLWGAEEVGLLGAKAYAEAHAQDKHVLAAESDFGAGRIWQLNSEVPPQALPVMKSIAQVLAPLGIALGSNNKTSGPDITPLRAQGVPTMSLAQDGRDYFDLHHTPDDTLDKIDPKALDQNVAAYAAAVWIAANSDTSLRPTNFAEKQ